MYYATYGSEYLHDPFSENQVVSDLSINGKVNAQGSCDFTIAPSHPLYDKLKIRDLSEPVRIYEDSTCLFDGYVYQVEDQFDKSRNVSCNGSLSYLGDSIVRPYATVKSDDDQPGMLYSGSSAGGLFSWYIDQHNQHTDSVKHFIVGKNEGSQLDSNDKIYRSNVNYPTTSSEIEDKLLNTLGGYIFTRYENDTRYIDYFADCIDVNAQVIDFGVNITDYTKSDTAESMYTVLIPQGATPESKDDSNKKQYPIDIKSIPDGQTSISGIYKSGDHIYDKEAVDKYGMIEKFETFSDIYDPENLLKAAALSLKTQSTPVTKIEVKAVDLSLYMDNYKPLVPGQLVRIRSIPHNIDTYMLLSEMAIDIDDPSNTTYTFGITYDTLTGQQSKRIQELNSSINESLDTVASIDQATKDNAVAVGAATKIANDAKDTANTAKDTADTAKNTADTANTTANKAQNTANSAKDTADKAQTAATEAKTTANSANKAAEELKKKTAEIDKQVEAASNAANAASAKADQVRTDLQKQVDATKNDLNNLTIGGTNLLQNTSSKWSDWIVITPNAVNFTVHIGILIIEDGLVPDTWYSSQIELEFADVTSTEGHTAIARSQGSVDNSWIGIWNPFTNGLLPNGTAIKNTVYSLKHSNKAKDINANNTRFDFGIRCDYFASGKFRYRKVKCEAGNKPTDWSPAPEDLTQQVQNVKSEMDSAVKAAQSAADTAQKAADKANASTADLDKSIKAVDAKAIAAKQAAAEAQSKAENVASDLDSANAVIEQHTTELGELTTKVSNAVKKSDSALSVSTEAKQTATEASTTATSAYNDSQTALTQSTTATQTATAAKTTAESASKTASDSLKQSSAAVQTANQISTTLRTEYQTKAAADKIYATQSSLKQTSDSITASVSKTYATKDALSALQNVADNAIESWRGTGVPTLENKPASDWTTNDDKKKHSGDLYYDKSTGKAYRFGSDDGVTYTWELNQDTDVTKALEDAANAQTSANNAQASATAANTAAGKAQLTANTAVSNAATAKNAADAAQSSANKAQGDVDKLKIDIPETYATKSSLTQTAESITANVESVKTTANSAVTAASKAQQTADAVTLNLSKNYNTKAQNDALYATQTSLKATSDSLGASISSTAKTAQSAVEKATSLEANLNGFKTTVSNTYGRGGNLWVNQSFEKDKPLVGSLVADVKAPNGANACLLASRDHFADKATAFPVVPGNKYRVTAMCKCIAGTLPIHAGIWYTSLTSGHAYDSYAGPSSITDLADGWKNIIWNITCPSGKSAGVVYFQLEQPASGGSTQWYISNVVYTDVTGSQPAGDYATKSYVDQTANSIKAQVTEVAKTANGAMSKATTVEQTANGLSSKITEQAKTLTATVTTANEAKSTADSNKAAISQVSTTAGNALTKASTVEQNLNGFKTTVSQTYTTKDDFNNLTIGGRNLLLNSNFSKGTDNWVLELQSNGYGTVKAEALSGFAFATTMLTIDVTKNTSGLCRIYQLRSPNPMRTDMVDTISFWANASKSVPVLFGRNDDQRYITIQKGWHYYKATIPKWNGSNAFVIGFKNGFVGTLNITNIMWEHASKASQWSPAPEDLQPAGDYSTKSYVDQTAKSVALGVVQNYKGADGSGLATKSDITVAKNSITTTVSKTYQTKDDMKNYATQSQLTQTNDKVTIAFQNSQSVGGQNLLLKTSVPTVVTGSEGANQCVGNYVLAAGSLENLPVGMYHIQFKIKSDTAGGTAYPQWNTTPWNISKTKMNIGTEEQTYSADYYVSNNNYPNATKIMVRLDNAKGNVTIREMKFERGNSMTPWTAAPEDTMNDLTNAVQNQAGQIHNKADLLILDQYKNDTNTKINSTNSQVSDLNNAFNAERELRGSYIQFGSDITNNPYMDMGNPNSPNKMHLTNTKMSFMSNNTEVAYISDQQLMINNAQVVNDFRIGNFVWTKRSDGHTSLMYDPK